MLQDLFQKNNQGSALLEIVLVTFLFGVLGTGLLATLLSSAQISSRGAEHTLAAGYITEGIEAVRSIRDNDWSQLTNGTHGLSTGGGSYQLSGTSDALDGGVYTRTITIENVYRFGSLTGDIATSGVLDSATKKVTVSVTWQGGSGQNENIDSVFYVTNWGQQSWTQTLTTDFDTGDENSTDVATVSDGEVVLRVHDVNWENTHVQDVIDASGSGDRTQMVFDEADQIFYLLALNTAGDDFEAYDVSDVSASTPTKLGGYESASTNDMAVSDGYAFLATDDNAVEVDVVEVETMTRVTTIDLTGNADATTVVVTGTTLIIGRESSADEELYFYDVSTPSVPTLLGSTEMGSTMVDLAANSSYVFASSSTNSQELSVVQLSDRTQVDTLDLTGNDDAYDVRLSGNTLYVGRADGTAYDVAAVDVSDPIGAGLSVTSSLEVGSDVNGIALDPSGTFLFLATDLNTEEIWVVNLSTFTKEVGMDTSGSDSAQAVAVYGGHVYVGSAADASDLMILRVNPGGWNDPTLAASLDKTQTHNPNALVISGNYAYMVTNNNSSYEDFFIFDITTPTSPTTLGSLDLAADVTDIVVSGNYAYVSTSANAEEVKVIDISTKTSPTHVASFNAAGNQDGLSVAINGSVLFLGRMDSSNPELYAINITTPTSPTTLDTFEFSDDINALVVAGNYLYAATDATTRELSVIDISSPTSLSEIGGYNAPGGDDGISIDVSGTTLVLGRASGSNAELMVFDISTPSSPGLQGTGEVGDSIYGISLDGTDAVYLATGQTDEEFMRWDISTPTSPSLDASLDLNADAVDIVFEGSYAYMASSHDSQELQIIGEGAAPSEYVKEGVFTSQVYDAGSEVSWDMIEWTYSGTGSIEVRIRTADSEANLVTAEWVGSDGTGDTTYSTSGTVVTEDSGATGTRWIQWRAYVSGSGASTPSLEDLTIRYTP